MRPTRAFGSSTSRRSGSQRLMHLRCHQVCMRSWFLGLRYAVSPSSLLRSPPIYAAQGEACKSLPESLHAMKACPATVKTSDEAMRDEASAAESCRTSQRYLADLASIRFCHAELTRWHRPKQPNLALWEDRQLVKFCDSYGHRTAGKLERSATGRCSTAVSWLPVLRRCLHSLDCQNGSHIGTPVVPVQRNGCAFDNSDAKRNLLRVLDSTQQGTVSLASMLPNWTNALQVTGRAAG